MLLSVGSATVNILSVHCFHTLCCFNRKGRSISSPPSCTTHHTSIFPFILSFLLGNQSIPFGTRTASWAQAAILMMPTKSSQDCFVFQLSGHRMTTVLCFMPPSPAPWTMIGRVVAMLGAATTVQNPSILFSSENRFRLSLAAEVSATLLV